MANNNFQYSFTTSANQTEVFAYLLNPNNWWIGLFGETITGNSKAINDEFSFRAGNGVHYSHQQLIDLVPDKKIVWLVTESHLSFLQHPNEWANTNICFELEQEGSHTKVTFTHEGLVPSIECYNGCSTAWTGYLQNLENHFK